MPDTTTTAPPPAASTQEKVRPVRSACCADTTAIGAPSRTDRSAAPVELNPRLDEEEAAAAVAPATKITEAATKANVLMVG